MNDGLNVFSPLVRDWFLENFVSPTEIQTLSWPVIAAGEHILAAAPTGSGKTLTAFLWAVNQLAEGVWKTGQVSVLYVSPLKALNNDIRRNLETPLAELRRFYSERGAVFPDIQIFVRSGDTPADQRRKFLKKTPDILITTPESLNILLTSDSGRSALTRLKTVILDEVHSVAGSKRGVHLISAVERLTLLSGEFQRIALSATVRPMERIASFIGGGRPVRIIKSQAPKKYSMEVLCPPGDMEESGDEFWAKPVKLFRGYLEPDKSVVFFSNSRARTEKLTRLINEGQENPLVYSHHGSLSREIRYLVEQRLKEGQLRGIVATSSLELGIDIGELEKIVMIGTPKSIASAVQRTGRSGHGVGGTSRGIFFPLHSLDLLSAAVMSKCVQTQDVEEIFPLESPLDVLAQIILSMTAAEEWQVDELYDFIIRIDSYRNLRRNHFDLVLDMLAGRYADTRIRELTPRIMIDPVNQLISAKPSARMLLYLSGGTIPDRGYYQIRHAQTGAKIGELDEEFVWERSLGDTFTVGAGSWRIQQITHNDVLVMPLNTRATMAPFWRAEEIDGSFHFACKIGEFLEEAESSIQRADYKEYLVNEFSMEKTAAQRLVEFLKIEKDIAGALPHRRRILIEECEKDCPPGMKRVFIHTIRGGKVNRPLSLILAAMCEDIAGGSVEAVCSDTSIGLLVKKELELPDLAQIDEFKIEENLRNRLDKSGFFGAKFRECASIAMLLPKASFRRRTPLWLTRLRAKKVLEQVSRFGDFPIFLETWRSCLRDEFDLVSLRGLIEEIRSKEVSVTRVKTVLYSPFAENIVWKFTNRLMYADDAPESQPGKLNINLLREVSLSSHLRPSIPRELIEIFESKKQRTHRAYLPDFSELPEYLRDRMLVNFSDWTGLIEKMESDTGESISGHPHLYQRLFILDTASGNLKAAVALENLSMICSLPGLETARISTLDGAAAGIEIHRNEKPERTRNFLSAWLQYFGPVEVDRLPRLTGIDESEIAAALLSLSDEGAVVVDCLSSDAQSEQVCDRENFEILLRMLRKDLRPQIQALPSDKLALFLAVHQGAVRKDQDFTECLEKLLGYSAGAALWEKEIFPARLGSYRTTMIDGAFVEYGLMWIGSDRQKLLFCFPEDIDLFCGETGPQETTEMMQADEKIADLLAPGKGRHSFAEISSLTRLNSEQLSSLIWKAAWSGKITADQFAVVRRAVGNKFRLPQTNAAVSRRSGLNRWKTARPAGSWFGIEKSQKGDLIEEEERNRDRVRQLLMRYGILFRELLLREIPQLQWSRLLRTLRIMELSGEIIGGQFFEGIPGLQFVSKSGLEMIAGKLPEESIFWLCAVDPASLCGLKLGAGKVGLPSALPSNHIVYHGSRIVLISQRKGQKLEIPDPENFIPKYLSIFHDWLSRDFQPAGMVQVEKINGESAVVSPLRPILETAGFKKEYKYLILPRNH